MWWQITVNFGDTSYELKSLPMKKVLYYCISLSFFYQITELGHSFLAIWQTGKLLTDSSKLTGLTAGNLADFYHICMQKKKIEEKQSDFFSNCNLSNSSLIYELINESGGIWIMTQIIVKIFNFFSFFEILKEKFYWFIL